MKLDKKDIEAVIATNRFGMGARPGEIEAAKPNPREWLIRSLSSITPPPQAPNATSMLKLWEELKLQKKIAKANNMPKTLNSPEKMSKESMTTNNKIPPNLLFRNNSGLIVKQSINSNASINFRLLDFFSNHFSVSANSNGLKLLTPTLDWDAIAPNLMGPFSEMLIAVITHPAILLYLDNDKSVGPNSKKAKRQPKLGLNENLAREIFELHTMGVNSGYTQNDIIELAKAITGWSFIRQPSKNKKEEYQPYIYRKSSNEPGTRKILNKEYSEAKYSNHQAVSILKDLANHPKTAQHVCTKLARHFTKDQPEIKLINQMSRTWLKTQGNLKAVMETLILSDLAWQSKNLKYKSPREFLISAYRMVTKKTIDKENKLLFSDLKHLGQEPYSAGSPAGFDDTRASWDGSDELFNRIDWSAHFSSRLKKPSIQELAKTALNNTISNDTLTVINQAESQRQAVSLLLMSPEFLVR